jgi:hypothetical protein
MVHEMTDALHELGFDVKKSITESRFVHCCCYVMYDDDV